MILQGDCLEQLQTLANDSVDLLCTDPPYGYSFMGKDWDKAVPSVDIWRECLRVLKPGAFAFIMSAPRSDVQCAMITRLQDAGFRLDFTPIYWTYASGFPKAINTGKKIPEAKALEGSYGGFQPKPAVEVIIVAMKPLSEKTYVDQALKNGKGVTWLDDCRVPINDEGGVWGGGNATCAPTFNGSGWQHKYQSKRHESGRFPANLLVSDDVLTNGEYGHSAGKSREGGLGTEGAYSMFFGNKRNLNNGMRFGDSGGYSRFFDLDAWAKTLPFLIVPKASKGEKNDGLDTEKNFHPTVKPLKLMSYLITLGSREGDTTLDPFAGSGTTLIAAQLLGRKSIGIEREQEYVDIAEARLKHHRPELSLFAV